MDFSTLPPNEVERRRIASIAAWKKRQDDEWQRWYQARCDKFYWQNGRCCAGCDHWSSDAGDIGICTSAPPVSGMEVMRSLGISWSTYTPPPGRPFTRRDHVCGAFKDDFDWSSLDPEYLKSICAKPRKATEEQTDGE